MLDTITQAPWYIYSPQRLPGGPLAMIEMGLQCSRSRALNNCWFAVLLIAAKLSPAQSPSANCQPSSRIFSSSGISFSSSFVWCSSQGRAPLIIQTRTLLYKSRLARGTGRHTQSPDSDFWNYSDPWRTKLSNIFGDSDLSCRFIQTSRKWNSHSHIRSVTLMMLLRMCFLTMLISNQMYVVYQQITAGRISNNGFMDLPII